VCDRAVHRHNRCKKYMEWLNRMNEQGRGGINTMKTQQKRSKLYEEAAVQMN